MVSNKKYNELIEACDTFYKEVLRLQKHIQNDKDFLEAIEAGITHLEKANFELLVDKHNYRLENEKLREKNKYWERSFDIADTVANAIDTENKELKEKIKKLRLQKTALVETLKKFLEENKID